MSVTVTSAWTPPAAPANFQVTPDPVNSKIILTWDQSSLSDTDFSFYTIYRKLSTDAVYTPYIVISSKVVQRYTDYLAAQGVNYDYKLTQSKKVVGDIDLESETDNTSSAILALDDWFVIGVDLSESHSFILPVTNDSFQLPLQQEVFEPLGSNRKKIARGNVLGSEGSFDLAYSLDERTAARNNLTWLANTPGPHILKSPFGDVWQSEFSGPVFKYNPGGNMSVTITWIEVTE